MYCECELWWEGGKRGGLNQTNSKSIAKKKQNKKQKSAGKNGNDSSILKVTSHRREFYINYESLVRFYNPYDPITV